MEKGKSAPLRRKPAEKNPSAEGWKKLRPRRSDSTVSSRKVDRKKLQKKNTGGFVKNGSEKIKKKDTKKKGRKIGCGEIFCFA